MYKLNERILCFFIGKLYNYIVIYKSLAKYKIVTKWIISKKNIIIKRHDMFEFSEMIYNFGNILNI